ncbi:hypothetical protein JHW43_004797 [Diplocarpon mali]|nr:hypothetical protein JHW43_004797 [Diplocarpon mali]
MAKAFRELIGVGPSTASTKESVLIIIDAQNDTDLEEFLKSTGKNKLVLTDDMAHVCVSTMARQAAEKGYDVLIAEDPVGDRNIPDVDGEQLVRMALVELTEAFGTVKKSSCINLVARVSF